MSDTQIMLVPAGKDNKIPMWGIIAAELCVEGRTPLSIKSLPKGRFNPQYITESIPGGVAWVLPDKKSYLLIRGGGVRYGWKAIILPIVEIRHG